MEIIDTRYLAVFRGWKNTVILLTSIIAIFSSCTLETQNIKEQDIDLVINNINIIDVVNRKVIKNQSILITSDTILDVFDTNKISGDSKSVATINGKNKYILSGFWNMHTHMCWDFNLDKQLFPTLLSHGITGIRDMGGNTDILNEFKTQVTLHPESGPLIYGAGPILDGEDPIHPDFSVPLTKENFKHVLDSLFGKNVDFFKVYSLLPKGLVKEISKYSKKRSIPFAGHVSEYITPIEASKLGQKSFEHLNRIEDLRFDSVELKKFTQSAIANGSWLCPTLIIYKKTIDLAEEKDLYNPIYEKLNEILKSEWQHAKESKGGLSGSQEKKDNYKLRFEELKSLVKWFYDNELPMLIGSDFAGMPYVYPGLGFHEEMSILSGLGINNYDILKMATYNPAVYFGITSAHGTIAKGKIANLVILDRNPVENIENTQKIFKVIKSGKLVVNSVPTFNK